MSTQRDVRRLFEFARSQGLAAQGELVKKLQSGNPDIEETALIALARFGDETGCAAAMDWLLRLKHIQPGWPSAVAAMYAYLARFPARQDLRRLFVEWARNAASPLGLTDRWWLLEVDPSVLDESLSVEEATDAAFHWPGAEHILDGVVKV